MSNQKRIRIFSDGACELAELSGPEADATCLDLIEKLNAQKQSILVTSRFEEPEVRARAEILGVKILPKALASLILIDLVG